MRIPAVFRNLTWADFKAEIDFPAMEKCKAYAKGWPQKTGVILYGRVGNGKSFCAAEILKRIGGLWVNTANLLSDIFSNDGKELVRIASRTPLLVLDDLGAEHPAEWKKDPLYRIINARTEELLPTIVTTNLTSKQLESRLGERNWSRLWGMTGEVITFKGGDFRKDMR